MNDKPEPLKPLEKITEDASPLWNKCDGDYKVKMEAGKVCCYSGRIEERLVGKDWVEVSRCPYLSEVDHPQYTYRCKIDEFEQNDGRL